MIGMNLNQKFLMKNWKRLLVEQSKVNLKGMP